MARVNQFLSMIALILAIILMTVILVSGFYLLDGLASIGNNLVNPAECVGEIC